MDKATVAEILKEIAFAIELTDENPKKAIAYRRAARSVEKIEDLAKEIQEKNLMQYPGIGKQISEMITTLFQKKALPYHDLLMSKIPKSILELSHIPGLGSQRIKMLYENFNIQDLASLKKALSEGALQGIKSFGPAYLKKLTKRVIENGGPSLSFAKAYAIAQALQDTVADSVQKIEISGALRRSFETISEIDLLAHSDFPDVTLSKFISHFFVEKVLEFTPAFVSVTLKQGIKVNLHLVAEAAFPFALLTTTGSAKHVQELEKMAIRQKKSFNGLGSEHEIYANLKLPYIYPELREGFGEIAAAKKGRFEHLIEEGDLRGTFHCHTTDSDGHNSLEEMVQGAKELGFEYIGISDHSKSTSLANGLTEDRLLKQVEQIKKLNKSQGPTFQIFSGIECDILKDGALDFSDEILKKLDFVIVSVHRYFSMEKALMTKRIIKAIENPYTTMVGHLTGRLLTFRDPYELNVSKVIDACIANDKIIELNAYPSRLDMDWRYWIKAKDRGLKCCINPDAHSIYDLTYCRFGVMIARKGWLKKDDVINTYPLKKMKAFLKQRKLLS